ncbi:MAG: uncharacterized protein K0S58_1214 [Nitrospira sp.]|jgi:hypothetical protein|nr:uncharacterized protein [Nitrospira sp.]
MESWNGVGRGLIIVGLIVAAVGSLLTLVERWPTFGFALSWIGKLPGDLSIRREQFSIYIPIATSLVFSILLSLVLYILSWLFRR